ncbi:cytochrome c [Microaerobacter geothermalis]|uniref:c-type cytochrome n=1 Tax=Microaerobacter geothermalis TaxID=674972 RepID=UPI001F2A2281|nr:c-type cytochrome [Microaerobacter geothermalis]MCF6094169.1 cytochrome c [Microaerobacter geothermalis]
MKRTLWLVVLLGALMLILAGCGNSDKAEEPAKEQPAPQEQAAPAAEVVAKGEEVYKASCSGCHGQNLEGLVGPALDKVGAKYSLDEIKGIVEKGTDKGMPGGLVSGDDLDAVSAFLSTKK